MRNLPAYCQTSCFVNNWYFKIFMTALEYPSISSKKVIYFVHHLGVQKISCYTGTKMVRDLTKLYSKTLQLYCKQMYQKGLPTGNMIGFRLWILKWWIEAIFQGQCQTKKIMLPNFHAESHHSIFLPVSYHISTNVWLNFDKLSNLCFKSTVLGTKRKQLCFAYQIYIHVYIYIYIYIYI